MRSEKIREQYTQWASTYDDDKIKIFEQAGISYQEFMDTFTEFCELKPAMNILDVGVGTGLTSLHIAKYLSGNCKILGVEPVEEMIKRAKYNIKKESLEDVISIKKGIGENIPCENENLIWLFAPLPPATWTLERL